MSLELTWLELLKDLETATEEDCKVMLEQEKSGKARLNYLLRIYSRYNKLRTKRERQALLTEAQVEL